MSGRNPEATHREKSTTDDTGHVQPIRHGDKLPPERTGKHIPHVRYRVDFRVSDLEFPDHPAGPGGHDTEGDEADDSGDDTEDVEDGRDGENAEADLGLE
jgi:hypothetical protein